MPKKIKKFELLPKYIHALAAADGWTDPACINYVWVGYPPDCPAYPSGSVWSVSRQPLPDWYSNRTVIQHTLEHNYPDKVARYLRLVLSRHYHCAESVVTDAMLITAEARHLCEAVVRSLGQIEDSEVCES